MFIFVLMYLCIYAFMYLYIYVFMYIYIADDGDATPNLPTKIIPAKIR